MHQNVWVQLQNTGNSLYVFYSFSACMGLLQVQSHTSAHWAARCLDGDPSKNRYLVEGLTRAATKDYFCSRLISQKSYLLIY